MIRKLKLNKKHLKIVGIILLILALPLAIILVRQVQNYRSSAAAPDKLETEAGVLSGNVQKLSDSQASGGQFVRFARSSAPTPTTMPPVSPPPSGGGYGPRSDPPFPTGSNVVTIDSSVSTSDSDSGPEMMDFINSQPDGTTIIFDKTKGGAGSTYTINNAIHLNCRKNLTFWGYNSKLILTRTDGDHRGQGFTVRDGSENINILGFDLEGPNKPSDFRDLYNFLPGEADHGIGVYASRNVRVEDNKIHNTNGDGIYITGFSNKEPRCNKNWDTIGPFYFNYNHIYQVNRQGIINNDGVEVHIRHNLIEDIGMYPVDAEDGGSTDPPRRMDKVYITDNLFRRWSWFDVFSPMAVTNSFDVGKHNPVDYYEISRNVFDQGAGNSIWGCHWIIRHNNNHVLTRTMVISDNEFRMEPKHSTQCDSSKPDHGAIYVSNVDNLTIKNNDFQGLRILRRNIRSEDISGNGSSPITDSYYGGY